MNTKYILIKETINTPKFEISLELDHNGTPSSILLSSFGNYDQAMQYAYLLRTALEFYEYGTLSWGSTTIQLLTTNPTT